MFSLTWMSITLGAATALASILTEVALWQQKEYRWDRFWSHLRSPQGSLTNYPLVLLAIAAVLLGWISYLLPSIPPGVAETFGWIALLLLFTHHALRIRKRGLLRPKFTLKALAIIGVVSIVSLLYIPYSIFHIQLLIALQLATFIFLLPGLVALAVFLAGMPFQFRKRQIIAQATRLRAAFTQLTVVGITGSYGKTSTKHFLEHIVKSAGKHVAATQAHHNTPVGVSQDMVAQLKSELEVYIAELGAYRLGEIRELAEITQPDIGVITAIGNQHLDLFGSAENILRAKWELIEALPRDGIAVLNADDARLVQAAAGLHRPIVWYSTHRKADVWIEHLALRPKEFSCTLHMQNFTQGITIPLASEALLGSTLAAIGAAVALNISPAEIIQALTSLKPFERTMEVTSGHAGATVIDDSFSGNEVGTLIAIRHLGRFKEPDKRVVLFPLIELGSEAPRVHRAIGEAVRRAGAKLYVAGNTYRKELGPGVYEPDPARLAELVSANLSRETVVLLENRVPNVVRRAVLQ